MIFDPHLLGHIQVAHSIEAWVTPSVGSAFQLLNNFNIALLPPNPTVPVAHQQEVDADPGPVAAEAPTAQFYTYMESDVQPVNPRTLAVFEVGGLAEGSYSIEIRGFMRNGSRINQFRHKARWSTSITAIRTSNRLRAAHCFLNSPQVSDVRHFRSTGAAEANSNHSCC